MRTGSVFSLHEKRVPVVVLPVLIGTNLVGLKETVGFGASGMLEQRTLHVPLFTADELAPFWNDLVPLSEANFPLALAKAQVGGHMRSVDVFLRGIAKAGILPWTPLCTPDDWRHALKTTPLSPNVISAALASVAAYHKEFRASLGLLARPVPQLVAAAVASLAVPLNAVLDGVEVQRWIDSSLVALGPEGRLQCTPLMMLGVLHDIAPTADADWVALRATYTRAYYCLLSHEDLTRDLAISDGTAFEKTIALVLALRIVALSIVNSTPALLPRSSLDKPIPLTLSHLFPGAIMASSLRDLQIATQLNSWISQDGVYVRRADHHVPFSTLALTFSRVAHTTSGGDVWVSARTPSSPNQFPLVVGGAVAVNKPKTPSFDLWFELDKVVVRVCCEFRSTVEGATAAAIGAHSAKSLAASLHESTGKDWANTLSSESGNVWVRGKRVVSVFVTQGVVDSNCLSLAKDAASRLLGEDRSYLGAPGTALDCEDKVCDLPDRVASQSVVVSGGNGCRELLGVFTGLLDIIVQGVLLCCCVAL